MRLIVSNNKVELSDEELNQVTGGVIQAKTKDGIVRDIVVGDVVRISGYISGYNGDFCFVKFTPNGAYRFILYLPGEYPDTGILLQQFPDGVSLEIVGHDEEFARRNAV